MEKYNILILWLAHVYRSKLTFGELGEHLLFLPLQLTTAFCVKNNSILTSLVKCSLAMVFKAMVGSHHVWE